MKLFDSSRQCWKIPLGEHCRSAPHTWERSDGGKEQGASCNQLPVRHCYEAVACYFIAVSCCLPTNVTAC